MPDDAPAPPAPPAPAADVSGAASSARSAVGAAAAPLVKTRTTMRSGYKEGARGGYFWWWRPGRTWIMRSRPATLRAKEDGPKGRWISLLDPPFELGAFLRELDHETQVMFGHRTLSSFPREEQPRRTPAGVIRRAAVRRFFADVPLDVQVTLKTFRSGTWPLFRLLMTSEPARELTQSEDGARVAWLLGLAHRLLPVKDPLRRARRWATRKRRDILGALGFPATTSALSAVTRVPRLELGIWNAEELRKVLTTPHLAERVRHLQQISSTVIGLLAHTSVLHAVSPALLQELSHETLVGPYRGMIEVEVYETVSLLEQANMVVPVFQSRAHLRACHDRALAALSGRTPLEALEGPLPPLPIALSAEERAFIRPLMNCRAMIDEGNAMEHCLGKLPIHHHLARRGEFYAFEITQPERLTLAVRKVRGAWELYDLRGPENAWPTVPDSLRMAGALLDRFRSTPLWSGSGAGLLRCGRLAAGDADLPEQQEDLLPSWTD